MTDFTFDLYPKIYGPYKRFTEGDKKNQLNRDQLTNPAFGTLMNAPWVFTEKVDGTNIRIGWDGYEVRIGGRTDRAQLPGDLLSTLQQMFPEELMEQTFGDSPAILYGEGYGAGIQKGGGLYRPDKSFVLFDVKRGKWWLEYDNIESVADALGVDVVPMAFTTLDAMIIGVSAGMKSQWGDFYAEGVVGVPYGGLLNRDGSRIQVKVKHVDFYKENKE
jgi:hypothetical protein